MPITSKIFCNTEKRMIDDLNWLNVIEIEHNEEFELPG